MLERLGLYAEALGHARQALEPSRAAGHRDSQAIALSTIGWCLARLGDYEQALTPCQDALALLEELGDRYGKAGT
ncbi:MAG: tetratricopeptide repeat protein [Streptosporangiaceae bacterium]